MPSSRWHLLAALGVQIGGYLRDGHASDHHRAVNGRISIQGMGSPFAVATTSIPSPSGSGRYEGYASADMTLWDFGPDGNDQGHLVAYATQACFFTFA
jgi:hypothetical protein